MLSIYLQKMKKILLILALPFLAAACTTAIEAPPSEQASAPAAAMPLSVQAPTKIELAAEPTAESRSVQAMIQKWRDAGLSATALYQSTQNTIQWTVLRTILPANLKQAEEIVSEIAYFAKQSSKPVQLQLITSNHKDDIRLSKAIKDAAQKSGGKNIIKFDHLIEPRAQALIQLQLQGDK